MESTSVGQKYTLSWVHDCEILHARVAYNVWLYKNVDDSTLKNIFSPSLELKFGALHAEVWDFQCSVQSEKYTSSIKACSFP